MASVWRRLPAARVAVAIGFMLSGIAFASWVVRIPDIQRGLELSEGALGLVLLSVAFGGLLAMPLSGLLISRFGSRAVARGAALTLAISIMLPPRLSSVAALAGVLLVVGAATSVLSVALNTQAAALERRMKRPIMAGLHALYSVGGLLRASGRGRIWPVPECWWPSPPSRRRPHSWRARWMVAEERRPSSARGDRSC